MGGVGERRPTMRAASPLHTACAGGTVKDFNISPRLSWRQQLQPTNKQQSSAGCTWRPTRVPAPAKKPVAETLFFVLGRKKTGSNADRGGLITQPCPPSATVAYTMQRRRPSPPHPPGSPPVASVVVRVASTPETLPILMRCSTQKRWKPSPALNRKRWRSKKRRAEGTLAPVSLPTPST